MYHAGLHNWVLHKRKHIISLGLAMQISQALILITLEQLKSEMKRPTAYSAMPKKLKAKV